MAAVIQFPAPTKDMPMAELRRMSVAELRRLWDTIGDDSFSDGYDCADIHAVLNEKGDGAYCAV